MPEANQNEEKWTLETLENFFRHESMRGDTTCRKMALFLSQDNLIGLLLKSKPSDYIERVE